MLEQVLITGGTGFLGQNLAYRLRNAGMAVRILVRPHVATNPFDAIRMWRLQPMDAELVPGDVLDPASLKTALRNVSCVFHLAGRLFTPGIPISEYTRVHVEGTRNLLMACAHVDSIRAIVHCSTTGILGETGTSPAHEDMPLRPTNAYERTKATAEQLALSMARHYDLPLSVARPSLVYGPYDLHLLKWFRTIKNQPFCMVGPGANLLQPIYVGDVVEGLLRCAQTPSAVGRVYHLVGERPLPLYEFVEAIARIVGRRCKIKYISAPLAFSIVRLLELLPGFLHQFLPLTHNQIRLMTRSRVCSGARARDELGFVPRMDLETGLQRTVDWYRSEKLL